MNPILSKSPRLFLACLVLSMPAHAGGIPGFGLPPACPPNTSCVPGTPPIVPPTPPGTCGPGDSGPTCGSDGPASNNSAPSVNIGAGNPINIMNGNKYQREVDMAPLPGVLGLEIVRHYNSSFSRPHHSNNLVGRGWKLSYETELHVTGTSFQVIQADGARLIFHRDAKNPSLCASTNPADGVLNEVQTSRGKEYTWRWTNGRELTFNEKGKLVQILAPGGQFVTVQYDARGLLRTVTDPQGRSLRLHYAEKGDTSGRFRGVQAIDSPVGRFAYSYGSAMPKGAEGDSAIVLANLTKVSMPVGARHYHYEDARFPTLLTGISELTGGGTAPARWERIATYGYDANGKGNLSVRGLPATLARTTSGALAQPAVLVAGSGIDQVTLDHSRGGQTTVTNSRGQTTVYRYAISGAGYRLLEVRGAGCAACGETNVRYTYDQAGRMTGTTNLDAEGNPVASSEAVLDSLGRTVRVTRTIYQNGKPVSAHWQRRFEYAGESTQPSLIGRPSVIPGKEHVTLMRYAETGAAAGLPVEVTERGFAPSPDERAIVAITRTMSYRYNRYGQQTAVDGPLPNAAQGADPANSDITHTDYDPKNKLAVRTTLPGNVVTEVLERDAALRPTLVRTTDGTLVRTTATRYNWRGQPEEVSIVSGAGDTTLAQVTRYRYDLSGRLSALIQPDGTTVTPGQSESSGQAIHVAAHGATAPAALSGTRVETDWSSRPVAWTDPEGGTALRAAWGPIGTAAESMIQAFATNQVQAIRLVDDFGRVSAIRNPGQGWQIASHDAAGRITQMRDPRGAVQKASWDSAGRLQTLLRFQPGATEPEQTLAYRYQGMNVVEQRISDAQGKRVTSTGYDARGLMINQTLTIEPAGKLVQAMPAAISMTHQWRHDAQGRVIARLYTDHQGKQLELLQELDQKGMPVSLASAGALPANLGGGNTLVRNVQWQKQFATKIVHGDGSVDHFDIAAATSQEAAPPHLVKTAQSAPSGGQLPGSPGGDVDAAGLPANIGTEQGPQRLSWNAAGQLAQSTRLTDSSSYVYDAQGQRVVKLVTDAKGNTSASVSFYEANRLVAEADAQGAMRYAYAYLGWRPLAQFDLRATSVWQRIKTWLFGAAARALHTDRVGKVLSMSDNGKTVWQERAPVSGLVKVTTQTGVGLHQPLRYVGQYHDDDSALVYHGARYFDPARGRFLSPDPVGIGDALSNVSAPLLLDLYAYAGGRPDEFFDPDGAARIRYFAITTGANGQAIGVQQGFTQARWAFIVDNVVAGPGLNALGLTRNTYATNRTGLLVDIGGNFNAATPAQTWDGAGQEAAFRAHYGNNLVSLAEFTVEMSDDNATKLIATYIAADRTRLFGNACPARNPLLPAIRFAPGEADINVIRQVEPAIQGMPGNQANVQRILNCNRPTTVPVTYANDAERRRVMKYEAAAEMQEAPAPSAIYLDCSTNHGCRSATDITLNGHSYYASYGRTQFVSETFLRTLNNLVENLTPAELASLRLNTAVRLPDGTMGTMAQMAVLAQARAAAAGNAFRDFRVRFGTGRTTAQATAHWNSMTAAQRNRFTRDTGFGLTEFIDMLAFVPQGRARTENEALNAFGSEAARRILDGNNTRSFGDWLMWLYQSQDPYNFVSKRFLKSNLETIMNATAIAPRFVNNATPGTEAHRTRQRVIEDELARRTAITHNRGSGGTSVNINVPQYVQDYVNEFTRTAGRGDWRSLRCSDELGDTKGLQIQTLNLR
jgi:RHS repeat-associated protein